MVNEKQYRNRKPDEYIPRFWRNAEAETLRNPLKPSALTMINTFGRIRSDEIARVVAMSCA
jgi:hypothetical protein